MYGVKSEPRQTLHMVKGKFQIKGYGGRRDAFLYMITLPINSHITQLVYNHATLPNPIDAEFEAGLDKIECKNVLAGVANRVSAFVPHGGIFRCTLTGLLDTSRLTIFYKA